MSSTLVEELTAIKAVEDKLTANKVANFAYTNHAYENPLTEADGVQTYDVNNEQNIPVSNPSVLKVNPTILTKGWRSQASSITRMLMNHFLGRVSYNLNKVNDLFSLLLTKLMSYMGQPDGLATLDSNGHLVEQSPVGSPYVPLTKAFLGAVFGRFLGNVWKQGTGDNTSYNMSLLTHANGLWVAFGSSSFWWSEDGKSWTQGEGVINTSVQQLLYADGIWVCCCSGSGGCWWSEDGKSWTQGTGDTVGKTFSRLYHLNGLWLCSATSGSNYGCYWSEDGKNWTQGTGEGSGSQYLYDFAYANGLWVGCGTSRLCVWSEDGKNWTQGTGVSNVASTSGLIYANGIWVCRRSGKGCLWSEDGKTWAQGTGVSSTATVSQLVYANGIWVCAVNTSSTWWSEDGKSWTHGTGMPTTDNVSRITYANGIWVCYSTTSGSTSGYWFSADGKNWTQSTGGGTSAGDVVYINGRWLIRMSAHESYWSEDGVYWVKGKLIAYNTIPVYANGIMVCCIANSGCWYSSIDDLIADGTINLGADIPLVD